MEALLRVVLFRRRGAKRLRVERSASIAQLLIVEHRRSRRIRQKHVSGCRFRGFGAEPSDWQEVRSPSKKRCFPFVTRKKLVMTSTRSKRVLTFSTVIFMSFRMLGSVFFQPSGRGAYRARGDGEAPHTDEKGTRLCPKTLRSTTKPVRRWLPASTSWPMP